ncbi:MAG: pilus assembly protein HicB [Desulfamplus sp.]|nr:pilus assembly protein HicB [Desulfamplus sp.]
MNSIDKYHKWVDWSEEDQVYIGKCPDLITGIHGDDPLQVYKDICDVVEEVINHFESEKRPLPNAMVRPMKEVA